MPWCAHARARTTCCLRSRSGLFRMQKAPFQTWFIQIDNYRHMQLDSFVHKLPATRLLFAHKCSSIHPFGTLAHSCDACVCIQIRCHATLRRREATTRQPQGTNRMWAKKKSLLWKLLYWIKFDLHSVRFDAMMSTPLLIVVRCVISCRHRPTMP